MNCEKLGGLLSRLRTERGLTQKALAEALHISDRTVSKWERGIGCPDVSLLPALSAVFGVNVEKLLLGELSPNPADSGNLKKLKFYRCPRCGNILWSTGAADVACCGRKLEPLAAMPEDPDHRLCVQAEENELYVTLDHEMTKGHFISFAACVSDDRVLLIRLYPEQSAEVRFPKMGGGALYFCCSHHGLFQSVEKI